MCGIVGYIGNKDGLAAVTTGLKRLEYRGYDSAGVAFFDGKAKTLRPRVIKTVGKLDALLDALKGKRSFPLMPAIGHTRWATHGIPIKANAHPHLDCSREIALAHNGIIENYASLREVLEREGHTFRSATDTEVLAHLVERMIAFGARTLEEAVREALHHVQGTYGIVVVSSRWPDRIVGARKGSPLLVGIGDNESIIASDASAVAERTKKVIYLDDNEIVSITPTGHRIFDGFNNTLTKQFSLIDWTIEESQKGGFPHFMLKEIFEIPDVIENAIRGRVIAKDGIVKLGGIEKTVSKITAAKRIVITACGTSYYAGLVGKYLLESYAKMPTEVLYASEFRYAPPALDSSTVVVAVSQSGETADTLEAVREAKRAGALTLGIVNVVGSTIAREVDAGLYNHAGPEIAVASTKAFVSQIVILALLSFYIAQKINSGYSGRHATLLKELMALPHKCRKILEAHANIKKIAKKFYTFNNFLYLGRKFNYPTALEGALKLKEISYAHAEGYPAGEMKHGPIALIDPGMPTVVVALHDSVYEKIISNMEEIQARRGPLIVIATEGDKTISKYTKHVISLPNVSEALSPLLAVIPMQLFAYYIAVFRGTDVDKPRNLAKSVTVE